MVSWKETTINLLLLAPPQFCQAAAKSKLAELQALEDLVKKQRQVEELLRLKALQDQLQQLQTMTTIQSMKLVTKSPRKHLPVQSPQMCFLDKLIYRFFTSTLLMWDFKYIFSTIFSGGLKCHQFLNSSLSSLPRCGQCGNPTSPWCRIRLNTI